MKDKIEIIVGVTAFIIAAVIINLILGQFFVYFFVISLVFASIAIYLFSKKNVFAKVGGILMFEGIVLKVLMPAKYRKQINELNDKNET